ncbi:MAG: FAD-binding oxidoreductase [Bacteroidetes bacterium]|nr:FAD-binding oxidoreductase [Bacteroidota bacterium]
MQVDYIIIGQGISGTWLSYYLQKENKSYIVIDNKLPDAPSRLSAGIINPITGRRHVAAWMIEELLSFSLNAYNEMGNLLNITAISRKNIIDFFPSAQMRDSFQKRVAEQANYLSLEETISYSDYFNYELGYGIVTPTYTAHLENILPEWRKYLHQNKKLIEEYFDLQFLELTDNYVQYKDITAQKIIFCDGTASAQNRFFNLLPFAPNKGEALFLNIKNIPSNYIFKKGMILVPLASPDSWWIGASYEWDFKHTDPTNEFREKTEMLLKQWLKVPYQITNHIASVRPATLERRPFVGLHPQYPQVGILNGMGTKGCSLAPYFAHQLVLHLCHNQPITPEANVRRFTNVLSRKTNN